MRLIVLHKLHAKQARKKLDDPMADIVTETIALRLRAVGYITPGAGSRLVRDAIKGEFDLHFARTFLGQSIQGAGYRHSTTIRFKMMRFLQQHLSVDLDFDDANADLIDEQISIFLYRLQSEEILRTQLHRDYLLLPRLPDEEPWVEIQRFSWQLVQFLEGERPNKGQWTSRELRCLIYYSAAGGDLHGIAQLAGEWFGRSQRSVVDMIQQLRKEGQLPEVGLEEV